MGRTPGQKTVAVEQVIECRCLLLQAKDKAMWALKALRDADTALYELAGKIEQIKERDSA